MLESRRRRSTAGHAAACSALYSAIFSGLMPITMPMRSIVDSLTDALARYRVEHETPPRVDRHGHAPTLAGGKVLRALDGERLTAEVDRDERVIAHQLHRVDAAAPCGPIAEAAVLGTNPQHGISHAGGEQCVQCSASTFETSAR